MKVKEIKRTANVAWSPKQLHPIYLAAGTAAQQLDATFSTTAALEIYHVDLANKELEMPVAGSMPSEHRFHKLLWTDYGLNTTDHPSGMILGGTDNGNIIIIDAATILSGDHEVSVLDTLSDHTGAVQALDINKFQHNLIASGAAQSEIFIWDLQNPETPLTPGTKTSPPDQISYLSWNNQVQHILASSSQTGRVVIWDLRKSEPIIRVGDQSAMFNYKSMAWHPDVATQILIANEDDRYPVIQNWDLRFATSPIKIFEGHTRGVLSLDWCPQDSDLLLSCGKDNRILCWNPNTQLQNGEIIYELPTSAQWTSDVRWCPRNPGLISSTAFDGHITVSTLMGGSQQLQQNQQNQISDSFGIQPDASSLQPTSLIIEPLKKPPKWMRVPCAARFSFGGKLISCENISDPVSSSKIHISQVVTEQEFLDSSNVLETALLNGQLLEFCDLKIANESDPQEKLLWQFLKSNFHHEPRMQFLNLLGYNPDEIANKISLLSARKAATNSVGVNAEELASKIELLKANDDSLAENECTTSIAEIQTPSSDIVQLEDASPNDGNQDELPAGSIAAESTPQDLFNTFSTGQMQPSDDASIFDTIADNVGEVDENKILGGNKEIKDLPSSTAVRAFLIPTDNEVDGLVCQSLLAGNFEVAVDVCFNNSRIADGLLLAIVGGPELFARTQKQYLDQSQSAVSKIISAIVNRDWRSIVENAAIENWKEALSTLVTYSIAEEFSELCCILGERLENEVNDYNSALVCYICAGDVERMVACWKKSSDGTKPSPIKLHSMIEKMMVLKKSVENDSNPSLPNDSHVAEQLSAYAELLSSQGNLQNALVYLSVINDEGVAVLKDRVFKAHGGSTGNAPEFPFEKVDVQSPQIQGKQAATPVHDKSQSPTYGTPSYSNEREGISSFQPQPHMEQQDQYTTSSYYNPQPTYNPSGDQSNMYNPPPPHPNSYQQMDQASRTPDISSQSPAHSQYVSNSQNQLSQTQHHQIYNPGLPPPSPVNVSSSPQVFHPETNARHAVPPNENINPHPNIMKPAAPPPAGVPPPSGGSSIMSMKAVKEESGLAKKAPQSPMNFYNPVQQQQPQEMNGHISNAVPNRSIGSTVPPAQNLPKQPPKKEPIPLKSEKIRPPIPSEHMILQQIFDGMIDRCRGVTSNPQAKRKLDDVRRKLDVLYDLLGENRVSQNVLNGLHQMSQACQQSNYMAGIQIHTQMLTTGNFSEISSFMPGLKSLMQLSGQLKV